MNNISIRTLETKRLSIRKPTMEEQHRLWKVLIDENVNKDLFNSVE